MHLFLPQWSVFVSHLQVFVLLLQVPGTCTCTRYWFFKYRLTWYKYKYQVLVPSLFFKNLFDVYFLLESFSHTHVRRLGRSSTIMNVLPVVLLLLVRSMNIRLNVLWLFTVIFINYKIYSYNIYINIRTSTLIICFGSKNIERLSSWHRVTILS